MVITHKQFTNVTNNVAKNLVCFKTLCICNRKQFPGRLFLNTIWNHFMNLINLTF